MRALKSGASKVAVLRALAAIEPQRALHWLVDGQVPSGERLTDEEGVSILEQIAEQTGSNHASEISSALRQTGLNPSVKLFQFLANALNRSDRVGQLGEISERMLPRHGAVPDLLRVAAESAIAAGKPERAHSLLNRLGRINPTPATAQFIKRKRAELPSAKGTPVRIALVSSFTIDPLEPVLDTECRSAGLVPETYIAGFNTWERELRDPRSGLRAFEADLVFLSVSIDDLIPALSQSTGIGDLIEAGEHAVSRITAVAQAWRQQSDCALIVHAFQSVFSDIVIGAGRDSRGAWLRELNSRLADGLADIPNTFLLDLQDTLARAAGVADDAKLRHLGRLRLSHQVLPAVARAYVRIAVPWKGLTRKCVILDLDNTLWGGIVGEDGLNGLRLGDSSPGSEFVEFQRFLKSLIARGFILAVVSKNNEADALEVFRTHDAMVLREDDFVATRINWQPKPENVRSIAEELGIGVDSVIFVDDNPDERELMRQMLPQVLTVDLPNDPAVYRSTLEQLPELQVLHVTSEDRERTQLYRARRERETARGTATSMDDFLASLEIQVEIAPVVPATASRVQQLFQRTNQFNLTTRRYDLAVVESRGANASWRIFTARAGDRFSDHGLVAAVMVEVRAGRWHIENLVLSCRAIGYGVESALLAHVCEQAMKSRARQLTGDFIASPKNTPGSDFYARHGFSFDSESGAHTWTLNLDDERVDAPDWIALKVTDAA